MGEGGRIGIKCAFCWHGTVVCDSRGWEGFWVVPIYKEDIYETGGN